MLDERVRAAHGDAWEAEGRLRERSGGGACALAGVRLMASGLPHAQWNCGVVDDAARVDIVAVRNWYAARVSGAGVPWGLLVPASQPFAYGRLLRGKRCMGLLPDRFAPAAPPPGVVIATADGEDLERIVALDAEVFGEAVDQTRDWIAPHLDAAGFTVAVATIAGVAVGIANGLRTNGRAGPSVGIFGVAVAEHARRRGIGAALTAWLVARGFDEGATLAHLNPDTEAAARLYVRLGFVETTGFDIYTQCDARAAGGA